MIGDSVHAEPSAVLRAAGNRNPAAGVNLFAVAGVMEVEGPQEMTADEQLMRRIAGRPARQEPRGQSDPDAEAAFEELLARHGPAVRHRLGNLLRDAAAAEDMAQEVFLRLWTRADRWNGQGSLAAWLARIATNLALNHLRSVRRLRQQSLEPGRAGGQGRDMETHPAWLADADETAPEVAAERAETGQRLARLLDDLPPGQREVLRLVDEEDRNIAEAAEELGIPQGTVKSRLHYARETMAREWKRLMDSMGEL